MVALADPIEPPWDRWNARCGRRDILPFLPHAVRWAAGKPCGGGITYKAYTQYPYLRENGTPKKIVSETYLAAPKTEPVKMALNQVRLHLMRH